VAELVSWLFLILFFLVLAALPVTMAAVAVRPSQLTLRAAGISLFAVPVVIALAVLLGALA
jgi:hypothetical protein